MRTTLPFIATAVLLASCAHSPYAGWESREVKSLSQSDIQGLRAGRGMSLALPAELNGFPGPLHVLELKSQLALSPEQTQRTEGLYARMKAAAVAAGEEVIASERAVERVFAGRGSSSESLRQALSLAGAAQARLRAVHLEAHLEQSAILSGEQIASYGRLRGYTQ